MKAPEEYVKEYIELVKISEHVFKENEKNYVEKIIKSGDHKTFRNRFLSNVYFWSAIGMEIPKKIIETFMY